MRYASPKFVHETHAYAYAYTQTNDVRATSSGSERYATPRASTTTRANGPAATSGAIAGAATTGFLGSLSANVIGFDGAADAGEANSTAATTTTACDLMFVMRRVYGIEKGTLPFFSSKRHPGSFVRKRGVSPFRLLSRRAG